MSQKNVRIVLCPGRFPEPEHEALYSEIYKCWHDVWSETFLDLDKNPKIFSDAFTRQDVIAAILIDGQCKGVSLHRYTSKSALTNSRDSYFDNWSQLHIQKLCEMGPRILVSSYFTIHESARGQSTGISMKDYLLALTTQVFLDSNCDAMTGAARKNRKVHDITYAWGAVPVGIDVPSGHGDALVDLVAFYKKEVSEKRLENPITPHFNELWENKLVIAQQHPQNIVDLDRRKRSVAVANDRRRFDIISSFKCDSKKAAS